MGRKVLISFLGTGAYEEAKYYYKKDKQDISAPVRYVQEYILKRFCSDWKNNDLALFVTTKKAIESNWINRSFRNKETGKFEIAENDGLKSKLETLKSENKIFLNYENLLIDDGDNEEEIWAIFKTIENKINEIDLAKGEEISLILDVTHSFRYLPMLGIVLINYLSVFKKVKVEKILYGNYEKGLKDNGDSPVIDLTSFVSLQKWAMITNEFVNLGESRSFNETGSEQNLSKMLKDLVSSIKTSRGGRLMKDFDFDALKKEMEAVKQKTSPEQEQMKKIIEKIESKVSPYENNSYKNGLHAVQWCIDYQLIQQGYTLLQESMVSWLIELVHPNETYSHKNKLLSLSFNQEYRDAATAALNGNPETVRPNTPCEKTKKMYIELSNYDEKGEIIRLFKKMTGLKGLRNDVNHGGFKAKYSTSDKLTTELETIYKNFKSHIGLI